MIGLQISMQMSISLLALAFMLLSFVVAFIVTANVTEDQRYTDDRVAKMGALKFVDVEKEEENEILKKKKKKLKKKSDKSLANELEERLFDELLAADIAMKADEFMTMWIAVTFAPAGVAFLFVANKAIPVILLVVCAVGPLLYIKQKQKKRRKVFESQLCDALMISCSCLRSGLTFQQAMETIAKDMEAPISTEFARAVSEINFGSNMDTALNSMVERIQSSDLMLAVSAISVQRQTGGNLSQILETISNTIRERIKVKADVSATTSQGRMSGLLIGALPILLGGAISVINPEYMTPLFTTSAGRIMLIVCIVLECLGFLAIRKIVDIKY
jgi:tight adherence protein B